MANTSAGVPALSQLYSPAAPPGSETRGTDTVVIVSLDNPLTPQVATVAVRDKMPFESGYAIPAGMGPFTLGGVNTTSSTAVSGGATTVTPTAMIAGLKVGDALLCSNSDNSNAEYIQVTAVTSTTFTATFSSSKTGTWNITSGIFTYNNSSGTGGSIVQADLDGRLILSNPIGYSTIAPTPYYKALADHKHSGDLNPGGYLNPQPVDLGTETSGTLPYPSLPSQLTGLVDSSGNVIATEFPGQLTLITSGTYKGLFEQTVNALQDPNGYPMVANQQWLWVTWVSITTDNTKSWGPSFTDGSGNYYWLVFTSSTAWSLFRNASTIATGSVTNGLSNNTQHVFQVGIEYLGGTNYRVVGQVDGQPVVDFTDTSSNLGTTLYPGFKAFFSNFIYHRGYDFYTQIPLLANAANPSPSTPPVKASSTSVTYPSITAGSYDAAFGFSLTQPSGYTVWLCEIRLFAVGHGQTFNTSNAIPKGVLAVTSGNYNAVVGGLSSGQSYDIYACYIDGQGTISAGVLLVTTSPWNASTATPAAVASGSSTVSNLNNATFDVQQSFTLDSNGYTSNPFLGEIQLWAKCSNPTNSTGEFRCGTLVPLPSGTYTGVWGGLGNGNTYNLYVKYADFAGRISNISNAIDSSVAAGGIGPIAFAPNPSPSTAPTLSGTPGSWTYLAESGAYDAELTFGLTLPTNWTNWLTEVICFAVPHVASPPATTSPSGTIIKTRIPVGNVSPATYTAVMDGFVAGKQYDVYVCYCDSTGALSTGTYLKTTDANALIIAQGNLASGASGVNPVVTLSGSATYTAMNNATFDIQQQFTLDSTGYDVNSSWLSQVEYLAQAVGGGANAVVVGQAQSLATNGATYTGVWGGLGNGQTYNLYIRYVDFAGNRSNSTLVLSNVSASGIGRQAQAGNPNITTAPVVAASPAPAISGYVGSGSGAYDARITFTLTQPAGYTTWLYEVRVYAVPSGTSFTHNVANPFASLDKAAHKATLPPTTGAYSAMISGLSAGTAYDLYPVYIDGQGQMSATTASAMLTTSTNPIVVGNPGQAYGASGVTPVITLVSDNGASASSSATYDESVSFSTDSNGYNSNNWLAEVQLWADANNANKPALVGTLAPIASASAPYIGIFSGLGAGNTYKLYVKYRDYAGNLSNLSNAFLTLSGQTQGGGSLSGVPGGLVFTASVASAVAGSLTNGASTFTYKFNLTVNITSGGGTVSSWLKSINVLTAPTGTNNWTVNTSIPTSAVGTFNGVTISGLAMGVAYDVAVQLVGLNASTSSTVSTGFTTTAQTGGNNGLTAMPSSIKSAGPAISGTPTINVLTTRGISYGFNLQFTETDFTTTPTWISEILITVDKTQTATPGEMYKISPQSSTSGTYSLHTFSGLGDKFQVGVAYKDLQGTISNWVWPAAWTFTDSNGDFVDASGKTLHTRMSAGVTTVIDSSGNNLATEFSGAYRVQSGNYWTNMDTKVSTRTIDGTLHPTINLNMTAAKGTTGSGNPLAFFVGDNAMQNGYRLGINSAGLVFISKVVTGTNTSLQTVSFVNDTNPHTISATVIVKGTSSNTLGVIVDGVEIATLNDTAVNLSSTLYIGLYTSGSTGKVYDYEVFATYGPYLSMHPTYRTNFDSSGNATGSKFLNQNVPSSTSYYTNFVLNASVSGTSPNITMTYWFDNGSGGDVTFFVPSYTSTVGDQNFVPGTTSGCAGPGHTTSGSPSGTISSLLSTNTVYFLAYYTKTGGWTISHQTSPFTYSQIQTAYADGGYVACMATTNGGNSGISAGSGGSRTGQGGHNVY